MFILFYFLFFGKGVDEEYDIRFWLSETENRFLHNFWHDQK